MEEYLTPYHTKDSNLIDSLQKCQLVHQIEYNNDRSLPQLHQMPSVEKGS